MDSMVYSTLSNCTLSTEETSIEPNRRNRNQMLSLSGRGRVHRMNSPPDKFFILWVLCMCSICRVSSAWMFLLRCDSKRGCKTTVFNIENIFILVLNKWISRNTCYILYWSKNVFAKTAIFFSFSDNLVGNDKYASCSALEEHLTHCLWKIDNCTYVWLTIT